MPDFIINVKNNEESLEWIKENKCSVARFGDGEFDIIAGRDIPYQDYDEKLARTMCEILSIQSDENYLVCLPDVFERTERYTQGVVDFWENHLANNKHLYIENCKNEWYGSTFLSRPYIDLADKSGCGEYFENLKGLWENRDVLIVEGKTSRSGVGNDLFDKAASVKRIICPSKNAYFRLNDIENIIRRYGKDKLVLVMLGPTAKAISYDLSKEGFWIVDIGHIDSEYEWYRMGAVTKVKLSTKHTAEHNYDQNIQFEEDEEYDNQIIIDISDFEKTYIDESYSKVSETKDESSFKGIPTEIATKIRDNNIDAEAYYQLGEYLEKINRKQAYLCYENAAFHDKTGEISKKAVEKVEYLKEAGWDVKKASIVILNYNLVDVMTDCIESIRKTTPETARDIIIIDNGSTDGSVEYLDKQDDIITIKNKENVGFPAGCNQGIAAASKETDVFLLNNDIIMCDNTLFWLRMALYERNEHGCVGCVTNNIGHDQAIIEKDLPIDRYLEFSKEINVLRDNAYEYRPFLVGFALLIKREVINKVGVLDDIYTPGNYEDDDYGIRCLMHGYQNVLVHNSFIIHLGSKSFGKRNDYSDILTRNHMHFDRKYGFDNSDLDLSFRNHTYLLFEHLESDFKYNSVLCVNCSMACELLRLKWERPEVYFEGVGSDLTVAQFSSKYENVTINCCADVRDYTPIRSAYDVIIINISVHDSISVDEYINKFKPYCDKGAKIIVNIGNRRFYSNWLPLVTEGKNVKSMINGVVNEHDLDEMLVKSGCGLEKWVQIYSSSNIERERELLEKIGDSVDEGYRFRCFSYATIAYVQ